MGIQQPFDVKQRYFLGEFDPSDDDPDDIEYLTSGRAAKDARMNQVTATAEKDREARSQAVQEYRATSLSPSQDAIVPDDGSAQQAIAQEAEGPQDDTAESELDVGQVAFDGYSYLVRGELAPEGEGFAPFPLIKKYPYLFIGKTNQKKVAEGYFDKGQIYNHPWDFFYIHRLKSQDLNAIVLVPTTQFTDFLNKINKALGIRLIIPSGESGKPFEVFFDHIGTPCPRYFGRAATSSDFEFLRQYNIPPAGARLDSEPAAMKPTDSSVEAFVAKIKMMMVVQKAKNKANKEEAKKARIKAKKEWGHSIKRVQRFTGLRAVQEKEEVEEPNTTVSSWDKCVPAPKIKAPLFKAEELAPSDRDKDVVFICIDIEAMEQSNNIITEIGIASLDTRHIATVAPGENGKVMNWLKHIHARHFRIEEYKHHVNTHCKGCPADFEFGQSEFIRSTDSIACIQSCLKEPFCKQEPDTVRTPVSDMKKLPERNIVLVGHDLQQDINYLQKIGYDICHLSNVIDHVDTKLMYQYLVRAPQPTSLSNILAELRIPGWFPHNGGNDAVYTLKAMLGIAIRHLTDKERAEEKKVEFELAEKKRNEEYRAVAEAEAAVKDQHEGWSSAGEGSDGGDPVKPTTSTRPTKVKSRFSQPPQETQSTPTKPQPVMKNTSGSWRAPQAGTQVNKPVSSVGLSADGTTVEGELYVYPHLRHLNKKTTAWEDETPSAAPARQVSSAVGRGVDKENAGGEPYILPHLRRPKKKTTAWDDEPPLTTPPIQNEDLITFSDQGDEGDNNWGANPSSSNTNTETKTRRTTAWEDEKKKPPRASEQNANKFAARLQEKTPRSTARKDRLQLSSQEQDKFKVDTLLLKRRLENTKPRTTPWDDEDTEQTAINNALANVYGEELEKRHQRHNPKQRRTTTREDEPKAAERTTNALARLSLSLKEKKERTSEWVSGPGSGSTSMSGWREEYPKVEGEGMNGGSEGVEGEGKDGEVRLGSGIGRKPAPPTMTGGN